MSLPEGKCERMGEQLACALRHWDESDLPEYFPIDGQTIGSSGHEAWLSQWFSTQASVTEMASTIKNGLRLTEYRALLGFTDFKPETFTRNADPGLAMLFAWFEHHKINRPPEIFDSAWCIRKLKEIRNTFFTTRKDADLDILVLQTRKMLERCFKIFLGYTWGLLSEKSNTSFQFLLTEGKEKTEHPRFLHKIKTPDELVILLACGKHKNHKESLMMARSIQVLEWTIEAVNEHGKDIVNSFISEQWNIGDRIVGSLRVLNQKHLNHGSHDQNHGLGDSFDAQEFYNLLVLVLNDLEEWEEKKMLPQVVERQSLERVESDTVVKMSVLTNPVVSAATKNEPKTIELMYENQEPPSSGEKVFLYCKDTKARVKNFYTFAVPAGAVETSPLLQGDGDL